MTRVMHKQGFHRNLLLTTANELPCPLTISSNMRKRIQDLRDPGIRPHLSEERRKNVLSWPLRLR